jgi:biotin-dependent carboxylase-like uncharacterized protein
MVFEVKKPGMSTTVQDLGRPCYLRYGVPVSGAMDSFSLVAANALVGNKLDDAGFETTLIGPELQALGEGQIAITGGNSQPRINDETVSMWETLDVHVGDVISFGRMESGCRSYISMRGGINTPGVLGSRSTFTRGGFGGIEGRRLRTGDVVEAIDTALLKVKYSVPVKLRPLFDGHFQVQVVLGPQADMFTENGLDTFLSSPYKITPEADRMGYRLDGPQIEHVRKADIVSDALLPGAIQVPKDGKPIVIMKDAQTTGGYPKIAVATTPDISQLGQARTNNSVEFRKTTVREAQEKAREHFALLNNLRSLLETSEF